MDGEDGIFEVEVDIPLRARDGIEPQAREEGRLSALPFLDLSIKEAAPRLGRPEALEAYPRYSSTQPGTTS